MPKGFAVIVEDKEVNDLFARYAERLGPGLKGAVYRACLRIEAGGKEDAPVFTGEMRSSLTSEVTEQGNQIIGTVSATGPGGKYAHFVHGWQEGGRWVGPKRHFVPFSVAPGLRLWLIRKAGWDPAQVAKMRGIQVGGKPPKVFLAPHLTKEREHTLNDIRDTLNGGS